MAAAALPCARTSINLSCPADAAGGTVSATKNVKVCPAASGPVELIATVESGTPSAGAMSAKSAAAATHGDALTAVDKSNVSVPLPVLVNVWAKYTVAPSGTKRVCVLVSVNAATC